MMKLCCNFFSLIAQTHYIPLTGSVKIIGAVTIMRRLNYHHTIMSRVMQASIHFASHKQFRHYTITQIEKIERSSSNDSQVHRKPIPIYILIQGALGMRW